MTTDKRFAVVAEARPFQDWGRYTVKGEEFSAALPASPAMTTQKTQVALMTTRTERVLGSYSEGVAYAINTYENVLRHSLDEFIANIRAKRSRIREWSDQKDITVDGFAGKQFTILERGVPGVAQFFRTKDHLYWFEAMGAPADDPRMQRFFTSLVLSKKLEATEVRDGIGAQPEDSIDPSTILNGRDVDQKVVVLTRPEPSYTEDARRGRITGVVVIKAVFGSHGAVTNIRTVSQLPLGLTEQAIRAAQQIRFVPAVKDGKRVSMWLQLEYNFNLY